MERIEEAIRKSKTSPKREPKRILRGQGDRPAVHPAYTPLSSMSRWEPPGVALDAAHLERHKIVAHAMTDPSHVAFKILRTRLNQILTEQQWANTVVTSPTAGCGKTMVAINLAFALAHQTDCRTVLIDLDLKKSSVAKTLGVKAKHSMGQYLKGECPLEDCFVRINENLFVGLNHSPIKNFSEMALDERVQTILPQVMEALRPQVVILDLPPMLAGDEVMAYMPLVDSGFLIAAAGKTTVREIEECERQLSSATNFLGVVLNKCTEESIESYQYEEF